LGFPEEEIEVHDQIFGYVSSLTVKRETISISEMSKLLAFCKTEESGGARVNIRLFSEVKAFHESLSLPKLPLLHILRRQTGAWSKILKRETNGNRAPKTVEPT